MNKKIYLFGFVIFCLIVSGLLYYIGIETRSLYLESDVVILEVQKKHQSVAAMEAAARKRSFILVKMLNEDDIFERDQLHLRFDRQAFEFIKNRDIFLSTQLSEEEKKIFDELLELIKLAEVHDTDAANYMMEDNMLAAERILFGDAFPRLYKIIENFSILLTIVDGKNQAVLIRLKSQLKNNLYAILLLATLLVFAAALLIYGMFVRMKRDADLLTGSEAVRDSILDTAMDAILSVDKKGVISRFNRSAENMFGYTATEITGLSVETILLEDFEFRLDELQQAEIKYKSKSLSGIGHEVTGLHKDGSVMPLQVSMSDTGIDGSTQFSLIIRNLTEIKASEEVLKQRTQELEFANTKYKQLSETDPLTQISNRRVYEERIANEINSAKRSGSSVSLLMIDVDFFKKYNDNYGHDSGDVALIRVAKTVVESLPRSTDLAVRFGGEEFLVLMPQTDVDGAYTVAERIRLNVKALAIPHEYSDVSPVVTVSIGLASLKGGGLNEVDLLKQADIALYNAKNNGRNRCEIYSEKLSE